eukprot:TRINITY_DN25212_c0_g1_i1.p1 TRINITY_DN25212_c0_g1~~TRINITY_DN25212_c0_g1_i1.p1  ORF type:complete len:160 (-),score=28.10 TRINITY_DN25212_c0_g1_i1:32-511(-)
MVKNNRVTLRRRNPYRTKNNRIKVVKTPGGRLVAQYLKKTSQRPKCGDCGTALPGIAVKRPREMSRISKRRKTVTRAYGGSRCANCVQDRIVRAFLIEEQKIVKAVVKQQKLAAPSKKQLRARKAAKAAAKAVSDKKKSGKPKKGSAAAKKSAPLKQRI